jgi:hypothetical protein
VCLFFGLGLLLHLRAGGWQVLAAPKAGLFFVVGFLISYFLVGKINYWIIITQARLRVKTYTQMAMGDKVAEVSRARRIVRFLQMLVCLLVPWRLYDLFYSWNFQ